MTMSSMFILLITIGYLTFVERSLQSLPRQELKTKFGDLWTIYKDDEENFLVPYYVATHLKQAYSAAYSLRRTIDEISQRTCVHFVRRTVGLHKDYLYFNTGRKCTTSIGRKEGKQQVTIGGRCTSSSILISKTLMMTLGVRRKQNFVQTGSDSFEISSVLEDSQVQTRNVEAALYQLGGPIPKINMAQKMRSKPGLFLPDQDVEAIRRAYHCPIKVVASRSWNRTHNPKCGIPQIQPSPILLHRIFGGKQALAGSYPWQVSIHEKESNQHFCGGVLINNLWFLSAAHCFLQSTDPYYYVGYLGKHELKDDTDGTKVEFHLIIYHRNYSVTSKQNDIALVKLKKPVEFSRHISPVCLPTGRIHDRGDELIVTGWGATKNNERSEKLRQVIVSLIDFNTCKKWYPQLGRGMLCAGHASGGKDACFGDSGGPLVSWGSKGPFEVIGIVSWGKGCGKAEKPGVYTNVTDFLDWIYDAIERHR